MKVGVTMSDINNKIPSQAEVRLIFNDTYNVFYKKWKDISNPEDWVKIAQDMRDINNRYNCELCKQILLELVKCIEAEYKTKGL
jgi:hypothetical protein